MTPLPPQFEHTTGEVPGAAPVALQVAHGASLTSVTVVVTPRRLLRTTGSAWIRGRRLGRGPRPLRAPGPCSAATEETTEKVAQIGTTATEAWKSTATRVAAAEATGPRAHLANLVVALALFRVGQHGVCAADFFETFLPGRDVSRDDSPWRAFDRPS